MSQHIVYKVVAKPCLVLKSSIFLFLCFVIPSIYFLFCIFFDLFFNLLSNHVALLDHSLTNSDNYDFSLPLLHWSKEGYWQKTAASATKMLQSWLTLQGWKAKTLAGEKKKFLLGKKVLMFKTWGTWNSLLNYRSGVQSALKLHYTHWSILERLKFRHCVWKYKFVLWLHFNFLRHCIFTSSHFKGKRAVLWHVLQVINGQARSALIIGILNLGSRFK